MRQRASVQDEGLSRFAENLVPGGQLPGTGGLPAFSCHQNPASPIPVLIAAPHGGRCYPAGVQRQMRNPGPAAMRLEDRYIDLVATKVAWATGAELLVAHAPRAMIDLNRSVDDMDWQMVDSATPRHETAWIENRRIRNGLGLVPRRLAGLGEIWNAPLREADLDARLSGIHVPYHERLAAMLAALRGRWGAALLIDLHSMPPLPAGPGKGSSARIVLGDRFGASCAGSLAAVAFDQLAGQGVPVAHNRPYAGGYVLERHCAPDRGLHGTQVEVCRSLYLDPGLVEPGDGFDEAVSVLSGLVRRLAEQVAVLRQGGVCALAAE